MSWYWRLSRALAPPGLGVLSRQFASLTEEGQRSVRSSLNDLPSEIALLPIRRVVPTMAALPGKLNTLTAEALATALLLNAAISVSTHSDLLERSARQLGIHIEIVELGR